MTGSFTHLELPVLARLAGQRVLGILSFQCVDCKHTWPHLALTWVPEIRTQVSMFVPQALYPWHHPLPFFLFLVVTCEDFRR